LADRKLNDVVQAIHDWACKMNVSPRYNMFREVMTKTTRDGNILLRVTVLRKEEQNNISRRIRIATTATTTTMRRYIL